MDVSRLFDRTQGGFLPERFAQAAIAVAVRWRVSVALAQPVFVDGKGGDGQRCAVVFPHGELAKDNTLPNKSTFRMFLGTDGTIGFVSDDGIDRDTTQFSVLPTPDLWRSQVDEWAWSGARKLGDRANRELCAQLTGNRVERAHDPFFDHIRLVGYAAIRRAYRTALERFAACLDPDVVAVAMETGQPTIATYNFCVSAPPGVPITWRRQAVKAYPLLASTYPGAEEVCRAIDTGKPLNQVLRQQFGCSRAVLRFLHGLTADACGPGPMPEPHILLTALQNCPPSWWPRTPDDWGAFKALLGIPERAHWPVRRIRELGPDWRGTLKRLGPPAALADLRDTASAISRHLLLPPLEATDQGWLHRFTPPTRAVLGRAISRLLYYRPLFEQIAVMNEWHRRHDTIAELYNRLVRGPPKSELTWPPLTEAYGATNGCRITPLTDGQALIDEGGAMDHCVRDRIDHCAFGSSHIVSITDDAGQRLATAELRLGDDGTLSIEQQRGFSNAEPPAQAVQALSEYLDVIGKGDLPVDIDGLNDALEKRNATENARRPLYRKIDADGQAALLDVYRPLLPRPFRSLTLAEFHRTLGIDDVIAYENSLAVPENVQIDSVRPDDPALWRHLLPDACEDDEAAFHSVITVHEPYKPPPGEPSMDEILDSIRRIVSENGEEGDDPPPENTPPLPAPIVVEEVPPPVEAPPALPPPRPRRRGKRDLADILAEMRRILASDE